MTSTAALETPFEDLEETENVGSQGSDYNERSNTRALTLHSDNAG